MKVAPPSNPPAGSLQERCAALEQQVARLQSERDGLIDELAEARRRANALFVTYPRQETLTSVERATAASAAPPEAPLRHRLADALNQAVKALLPGAHRLARRTIAERVER